MFRFFFHSINVSLSFYIPCTHIRIRVDMITLFLSHFYHKFRMHFLNFIFEIQIFLSAFTVGPFSRRRRSSLLSSSPQPKWKIMSIKSKNLKHEWIRCNRLIWYANVKSCAMGVSVCIAFFLCTYGSHWPTCHFLMLWYFQKKTRRIEHALSSSIWTLILCHILGFISIIPPLILKFG